MLEKAMPLISYRKENFPRVCFDLRSYVPKVLERIVDLRELDPIIFSIRHCCPCCAIKRADQNLLPWAEGNDHVKTAVSSWRVYVRPGCEDGCTCTHKDCAKNLISRLHGAFPAADHGGVSAEDMKHRMHTEIGDFAQENLIGQVRSPQLIAEKLDWLEQFYYDVFHCDKNHFVNMGLNRLKIRIF